MRQPTEYDDYLARSHFGSLDGLRCLCIMSVLWHHSESIVGTDIYHQSILGSRGFLGVDMFFVLSGFLITTLLLREENRFGRFSIYNFYVRRALRIFPIYYLTVGVITFYYAVLKDPDAYLHIAPYYYLYLSNYLNEHIPTLGITWSLAVEEQYYLLWPLVLLVTPRRHILLVLAGGIAVNQLIAIGSPLLSEHIDASSDQVFELKLPDSTFTPILLGSLIALVLQRREVFNFAYQILGARWACVPVAAALLIYLFTAPADISGYPRFLIHVLMGALLICLVVQEGNGFAFVLHWRPIARIGEISYGMYLYHLVALHVASAALPRMGLDVGLPGLLLYFAATIVMAELSYRLIETRFLRLKSAFTKQSPAVSETVRDRG